MTGDEKVFNTIESIERKYQIIYVDPPWSYKTWNKAEGDDKHTKTAEKHYPTMDIKDIMEFDVGSITEDDSVLLMWATFPCLPEAMNLIDAWGFTYVTNAFTWVKRNKKSEGWFWGLGHYTRANAEICLLARKGRGVKRINKSVHSVCDARISKHSEKPDEIRQNIVKLFGSDKSRLEMFARTKHTGWDIFGNEIADEEQTLKNLIEDSC